jgi:hypothetical protein
MKLLYLKFAAMRMLVFFFLFPLFVFSQKQIDLKKKFIGAYKGEISSFKLDTGEDLVDVASTSITIEITLNEVVFSIGSHELTGTYEVMFEADKYFLLDCKIPGRFAGERVVVYKRGKKISRDGLYPQPSAMLYKVK